MNNSKGIEKVKGLKKRIFASVPYYNCFAWGHNLLSGWNQYQKPPFWGEGVLMHITIIWKYMNAHGMLPIC